MPRVTTLNSPPDHRRLRWRYTLTDSSGRDAARRGREYQWQAVGRPLPCSRLRRARAGRALSRHLAPGSSCPQWVSSSSLERSEEHTPELQSRLHLVCRLLLEKKNRTTSSISTRARP